MIRWPYAVVSKSCRLGLVAGIWLLAFPDVRAQAPVLEYRIVAQYPHDPRAFTQGLLFHRGFLYESTGLYGKSSLRKVKLSSGRVLQRQHLADSLFGEGLALVGGRFFLLTWRAGRALVLRREDFSLLEEFRYTGEGWGLAFDGRHLVMSNGSAHLQFRDPSDFGVERTITVRDGDELVSALNELEFVRGAIYANVWQQDRLARINPVDGVVTGWLDMGSLAAAERRVGGGVANGIAWDGRRLWVTGKYWHTVYGLELWPE